MGFLVNVPQIRGLGLPAVQLSGGYFASKSPADVALGDLIDIMFTPIGSRPMNRAFGCALIDVLFDPNDPLIKQRINFYVQDAVATWAPHVVVQFIDFKMVGDVIKLGVTYYLQSDKISQTRALLIERKYLFRFQPGFRP